MKISRLAVVLVPLFVLSAVGCAEKKVAPPPKPSEAPKPPPAEPKPSEPRAAKECAGPLELSPAQELKFGDRAATLSGYKLAFTDKDADGALVLGVLGPINEDSGENVLALRKYVKFFQEQKADGIVVTGDVGEVADGIARVLKMLAESKLPVFVITGNRECRADFTDGVNAAKKDFANIVNMNEVRVVEFPEATLVSLPGYHNPEYVHCQAGCIYYKSTLDEVVKAAKEAKSPAVLISHGPPKGTGALALDYDKNGNQGNEEINKAIKAGGIAYGVFSNFKEAGGSATVDAEGTAAVKEGEAAKSLFLNPGPADTVGWEMNDKVKSVGMASLLTFKDGAASFKVHRLAAMTKAEKAEAKKLNPPEREAPKDAEAPKK